MFKNSLVSFATIQLISYKIYYFFFNSILTHFVSFITKDSHFPKNEKFINGHAFSRFLPKLSKT